MCFLIRAKATSLLISLISTAIFTTLSFSQTDFFWSTQGLNEGATNSDAVLELAPGESSSLYLYYSTDGPADSDLSVGAFLDVFTSQAGVIEFTRAETFDFDITVAGNDVGNRWTDENLGGGSFGETGSVTAQFIDEWHAFTVLGLGIVEPTGSGNFVDEGYDVAANAYLFGQIDIVAIGTGSVDLATQSGENLIVNGSEIVPATFGGATISVQIPEPSGAGLSVLLLGFVCGRRRR